MSEFRSKSASRCVLESFLENGKAQNTFLDLQGTGFVHLSVDPSSVLKNSFSAS